MNRIKKKFCKYLLNFAPSNKIRILLLRFAGYKIGKSVYIGEGILISDTLNRSNNVIIGDRVSIAPRVTIITDSSPNHSKLLKLFPLKSKDIIIYKDAWIGANVTILPGVTIGECSIIGAGSADSDYGVREFKSKFGGELVQYGRFLRVNNKLLYNIGKFGLKILQKSK